MKSPRGWRSYDDGPFPDAPLEPPDVYADDAPRCEASDVCANEPEAGETMCRECRGEEIDG